MPHPRTDGIYFLILGCALFVLSGLALTLATPGQLIDFKAIYYSGRCLLSGHDPYREDDMTQAYAAGEGQSFASPAMRRPNESVTLFVYPPTTLLIAVPFALLPLKTAVLLWQLLIASGVLLSSVLMWDLAADYAPRLSAVLIALWMIGSIGLFLIGNIAGLVVSLCLIAAWSFIRSRVVWVGLICLSFGLVIKPHDVALIWLYFLFAGASHRKSALQSLVIAAALGAVALLWISHAAPQWLPELKANLAETSAPGGRSDPGPNGVSNSTNGMIVDLQAAISFFRDDPAFYNSLAYAISGVLLLGWLLITFRSAPSLTRDLLALASVSTLTSIATYHRNYDARIALLAVPACALLWSQQNPRKYLAALFTFLLLLFTGDFTIAALLAFKRNMDMANATWLTRLAAVLIWRPLPFMLLSTTLIYIWATWQYSLLARIKPEQ